MKSKIPKSFMLLASTVSVVWDDIYCNRTEKYGEFSYSKSRITLSKTHFAEPISDDKIMDTFYHEKVHAILAAMNERDLNDNEKFVDVFAKLLRQSDESAKY